MWPDLERATERTHALSEVETFRLAAGRIVFDLDDEPLVFAGEVHGDHFRLPLDGIGDRLDDR
jgi:hypothetical protein